MAWKVHHEGAYAYRIAIPEKALCDTLYARHPVGNLLELGELLFDDLRIDDPIRSAFLKGNTREHLLLFYPDQGVEAAVPGDELVKIKFEIDTNPPAGARFERKYRLMPAPYEIRLYDAPSLFAGKVHAVLCRGWKNRVKGRDLYDYVFYRSQRIPLNLEHLNMRLQQNGFLQDGAEPNGPGLRDALCQRFEAIDFGDATRDVEPFIEETGQLRLWSADFFKQITEGLEVV